MNTQSITNTMEYMQKTMAVLGGNGFLGSNLVNYFLSLGFVVTPISKENYGEHTGKQFDVFINANGNSKRFWANQHPDEDYVLSVSSVAESIRNFTFEKYIFISSSDVYPDHGNPRSTREVEVIDESHLEPYGLHKHQAEQMVQKLNNYIVLRNSAMIGKGLRKGVVKDLLEGKALFVTSNSRLQFIQAEEVGRVIGSLLEKKVRNQILNCGGEGAVAIQDVAGILGVSITIQPDAQHQEYEMDVQKLDDLVKLKSSKEYLQAFKMS